MSCPDQTYVAVVDDGHGLADRGGLLLLPLGDQLTFQGPRLSCRSCSGPATHSATRRRGRPLAAWEQEARELVSQHAHTFPDQQFPNRVYWGVALTSRDADE